MTRYATTRLCLAAVAMLGAVASSTAISAQSSPYVYQIPQGAFNPSQFRRNLTLALPARPTNPNGPVATMGPGQGTIGSRIQVQLQRNVAAAPVILSFKAVVSRGVPARVHTRIFGGGSNYSTSAPIQLCIQGGGTWEAELVLANGQNLGVIGSFTPTNCPR